MRPIRVPNRILSIVFPISDCCTERQACRIAALMVVWVLGLWVEVGWSQSLEPAELVLHGGKIVTVDDSFRIVEAVAVSGGRVTAAGRNQDIRPLIGPATREINLQGRTVLPGIIDTHIHLQQYALHHTAPEVAPEVAHPQLIEGEEVGGILEEIKGRINRDLGAPDDPPWLIYVLRMGRAELTSLEFGQRVDRSHLDRLSPDRPLIVFPQGALTVVNSAGLAELSKSVPLEVLEVERDARGEPTGRLGPRSRAMVNHLVPGARVALADVRSGRWDQSKGIPFERWIELLARAYKEELEHWASAGVTTWQTKMHAEAHAAFSLVHRRGEMPIRLAYAPDPAMVEDVSAAAFQADMDDASSPYFWMVGINGSAGGQMVSAVCTTIPLRPSTIQYPDNCSLRPGSARWRTFYDLVRRGFRIGEFHAHGDLTVDYLLMLIEQASAEAGMTIDQIRQKRHAIDHCAMSPRTDQMARAVKLGVVWTCGPKYIGMASFAPYDPERLSKLLVPLQSMIEAGLRPGFHTDGHLGTKFLFKYLEMVVTRKDLSGRVWNQAEAIEREDALRMATIWNAEYILREDELGSIEPGKWADMIIIDRDYLTIPVEEIGRIQVLTTIVGGKIVYQRP